MRLFTTTAGIRCYLKHHRLGKQVGLVPTMGALHQGHLSLIQQARRDNDLVVISIYVNPLQFGPAEDFQQYPRQLEQDQQICEAAGVDAIFAPNVAEMGAEGNAATTSSPGITQVVPPASMISSLCGRSRIGHFQGVATIVTKLLNLIQPERAYFGEKDAQQLAIIRQLVADLNLVVEIVGCPIVREASGLAYSSRNQYLSAEQKEQAAVLYRALQQAENRFRAGEQNATSLIAAAMTEVASVRAVELEYIELVHPKTLAPLDKIDTQALLAIAARLGSTRLIDNMVLRNRQPIVAIDGPAGAGKSTVTRQVAETLGLLYLDTGAMYRAVTWLVLQSGISIDDEPAIAELVSQCEIKLETSDTSQMQVRVWINQQEVTQAIRSLEVTSQVSAIAAQSAVRQALVKQQQRWGETGGVVAEGRDIGTHVFPDAEVKIFLTASVEERARRRQKDLKNQGQTDVSLEQLKQAIQERDDKDSNRNLAPLRKAADAIEIQTDTLSIVEVTHNIISLYHQKLSASR